MDAVVGIQCKFSQGDRSLLWVNSLAFFCHLMLLYLVFALDAVVGMQGMCSEEDWSLLWVDPSLSFSCLPSFFLPYSSSRPENWPKNVVVVIILFVKGERDENHSRLCWLESQEAKRVLCICKGAGSCDFVWLLVSIMFRG